MHGFWFGAVAACVLATAVFPAAAVHAQNETASRPVPIEEWPQAKIIAMGQEIHTQDRAAWVATDVLTAALSADQLASVRGWIVTGEGSDRTVRFLTEGPDGLRAGWDVGVCGGRPGPLTVVEDPILTLTEHAAFEARRTAGANVGPLRCGPRANSVVARDPDSDGWLVWLLTAPTSNASLPVGGHYRFQISADGRQVLRRDQLSNSCLDLSRTPPAGPDGQPGALMVSQIVSSGPVETHVFLSLQSGLPIYVVAGTKLFAVEGARIRDVRTGR